MGTLTLPASGSVYVDANTVIYTVDQHPLYSPVCAPLWQAAQQGTIAVISSELVLLETLIVPYRTQDQYQIMLREKLWTLSGNTLLPITQEILREAARLRAGIPGLRTPDAIHAATALLHGCVLFVTNDIGFRRVPGLPIVLLDTILAAP